MSRVLIVYASHYGQTQLIAERIAQRLRGRGHSVDIADVRAASVPVPESYDVAVLGSRVEIGKHASSLIDYIREHHDALCAMPTAFFSVSMAAAALNPGKDPSGYMMTLFSEVGWYPAHYVAFGGGLPYRRYGHVLRWVMKRIAKSNGHTTDTSRDHEFTHWPDVDMFADRIEYIAGGQPSRTPARPEQPAITN